VADLYDVSGNTSCAAAQSHRKTAATIKAAILDLFWDSSKLAFYDYNLTSNARNSIFTTATFYPFWSGIIPAEVLADSNKAFGAFSAINMVLNRYNGSFPTTFLTTGLQWFGVTCVV
jgi:alpha,alpha-trehalase